MFDHIAFDADDTLWPNEGLFLEAQEKFKALLSEYHQGDHVEQSRYETEIRNIEHFGYGIKGFTLSMVETAIELTDGKVDGREIQRILDFAKEMLHAPVTPFDGVKETIVQLAQTYTLMIITKGDLIDQEAKIARSGLAAHFDRVEIVSQKTPAAYREILERNHIRPDRFVMIGNSLKSDVLPVVAIGGNAVYLPHQSRWQHEEADEPTERRYQRIDRVDQLPGLLAQLAEGRTDSHPEPDDTGTLGNARSRAKGTGNRFRG